MTVEKRATLAEKRAHQAIEEYKKSTTFDNEMTETRVVNYQMGFIDC